MLVKTFAKYRNDGHSIWVQRSSHGLHNIVEEHRHDYVELVYVVHGGGRHRINQQCFDIHAGDVYVILPGESHAYVDVGASGIEIINCLFEAESVLTAYPDQPDTVRELAYVAPFFEELALLPRNLQLTHEQSSAVVALLESMIQEGKDMEPGFGMVNRLKLIQLLILLSRCKLQQQSMQKQHRPLASGHEILVRRVRHHLEMNFHRKITAASLAKEFTISERHLNRVFKQETGMSITAMLQQIRIERAKHMLRETPKSIEAIALAVGFGDASFFTRLFARMVGSTPGNFRKQFKARKIS
ncbi:AraC family transcriptional regulator [Paenibacillus sp. 32352]|uniref:AraC family transcriptional regulator n=1 Tax=Paenibacillus sp. 32352 TaxID=1969111 RepID=UPI0009ADC475|nr:AraC family transcriptional regulator [Paenibacillus sp. 32352]